MKRSLAALPVAAPLVAILACLGVLVAQIGWAQEPTLAEPVVIEPLTTVPSPMPVTHQALAAPARVCHPIAVVDVRHKLSARRLLRRGGPQLDVTVCVDNPVDCCDKLFAVPLCVPECCVNPPRVCNARPGILPGRGKVDAVFDCGLVATITFLKHGGVIITYSAG